MEAEKENSKTLLNLQLSKEKIRSNNSRKFEYGYQLRNDVLKNKSRSKSPGPSRVKEFIYKKNEADKVKSDYCDKNKEYSNMNSYERNKSITNDKNSSENGLQIKQCTEITFTNNKSIKNSENEAKSDPAYLSDEYLSPDEDYNKIEKAVEDKPIDTKKSQTSNKEMKNLSNNNFENEEIKNHSLSNKSLKLEPENKQTHNESIPNIKGPRESEENINQSRSSNKFFVHDNDIDHVLDHPEHTYGNYSQRVIPNMQEIINDRQESIRADNKRKTGTIENYKYEMIDILEKSKPSFRNTTLKVENSANTADFNKNQSDDERLISFTPSERVRSKII